MMKMVQNTFEPPDIVTSWWRHQDYRMTSWKFSNKRKFTDRKYECKSRKWFWKVWKLDRYEWTMMTSSAMMTSSDKSRRSRTWKIRLSRWLTLKVIALTSLNQTTFRIQCTCTTIAEKSEILSEHMILIRLFYLSYRRNWILWLAWHFLTQLAHIAVSSGEFYQCGPRKISFTGNRRSV